MAEPMLLDGDGQTYERAAITKWLAGNNVSLSPGRCFRLEI